MMKTRYLKFVWPGLLIAISIMACNQIKKAMERGTYGYDVEFLQDHDVEFVEISSPDSLSRIIVVPDWQGRILTSTSGGGKGISLGWINYEFIEKGERSEQFNVFGGEERFWLGPEGGKYSIYFDEGADQVFRNWRVPAFIDTQAYSVVGRSTRSLTMESSALIRNASGSTFDLKVKRKVTLLTAGEFEADMGITLNNGISLVAYKSDNTLFNNGTEAWTKEGGLLSIWLLCMFSPSPEVTVIIPYNDDPALDSIPEVNDEYFGKVPAERLLKEDGRIFFRIDGKYRSKIGVPAGRAKNICGSYDAKNKILTIVSFNLPKSDASYVNSNWGEQDDPYNGDVVNSYNDGPLEDGSVMGPFYEIETSSPGAMLEAGESITHTQKVYHLEGDEEHLETVTLSVFGLSIAEIITKFNPKPK